MAYRVLLADPVRLAVTLRLGSFCYTKVGVLLLH